MTITPAGFALLRQFEGCQLTAYLCPAKIWTIGYGHTGPDVRPGQTITIAEAEALLQADVQHFASGVERLCPVTTPAQFSALVCLAFNIGLTRFQKSSVRRLHNAGDVVGAARAFALWNKATDAAGVKRELRGLTRRRAAEAALYLSDDGFDDTQRTRAADVAPEKNLATSRVMVGSSVGGAATMATGAAQLISEIEQVKDGLLPLMPYVPALQKLFVVLALAGIACAMFARWHDQRSGKL